MQLTTKSVPLLAIAAIGLFFLFPAKLLNEPSSKDRTALLSTASIRRIDVLGLVLLLGASILVSTGLQQAALDYAWSSAYVLPLLLLIIPLIIAFFVWEWYITTRRSSPEPVFPWRFCRSRIALRMILYVAPFACSQLYCSQVNISGTLSFPVPS